MASTNLGRVRIVPKGAHSATTTYSKLDLVTKDGSSYLYINDTPSSGTALSNATYWLPISKSAYDYAKESGYTGTSSQFATALKDVSNKVSKSGDTITGPLTINDVVKGSYKREIPYPPVGTDVNNVTRELVSAVGSNINLPTSGTGQGYLLHTVVTPNDIRIQIAFGLGMFSGGSAGKVYIRTKEENQSYTDWVLISDGKHTHGNITNDGKIGTDADKFLVTGTGGSIGVKTKQEAASLIGVSNPNILHNWDLRNPINQRQYTVGTDYTLANEYFIDRWKLSGSAALLSTEAIRVYSNSSILQLFERNLKGRTCTITIKRKGHSTYDKAVLSFPSDTGASYADITSRITVTLGIDSGVCYFKFNITGLATDIECVKLELGTNSTLHLDPPMDWAVELPKCKRFYIHNGTALPYSVGYNSTSNIIYTLYPPVPMRVIPSIIINNMSNLIYMSGVGAYTPTSMAISGSSKKEAVILSVNGSFGSYSNPTFSDNNNRFSLSADL